MLGPRALAAQGSSTDFCPVQIL